MKKEKKKPFESKLKQLCFIHWLRKKGKERGAVIFITRTAHLSVSNWTISKHW